MKSIVVYKFVSAPLCSRIYMHLLRTLWCSVNRYSFLFLPISTQASLIALMISSLEPNIRFPEYINRESSAHKFSIGFKSGLHGGNFITAIFRSVNHFKVWRETCEVALSCWKIGRIPEFSFKNGIRISSNISVYL